MVLQGVFGAVFIDVQISHSDRINITEFFERSWNAELLRNKAAEATGCLLRFPLLRVGSSVYSGVVASLNREGLLRVVASGSVVGALAIADYIFDYVRRRLTTPVSGKKNIVFFQAILSLKRDGPREHVHVDTSEAAAQWMRDHIAASTTAGGAHHLTRWWCSLTGSMVSYRQQRRALRIVCHFKVPPPPCAVCEANRVEHRDELAADDFFGESEMMSVVPMGSVFVAMPNGRELEANSYHKPQKRSRSRNSQGSVLFGVEESVKREDEGNDGCGDVVMGATESKQSELCPTVMKSQLKVEVILYHSGRVSATSDTMDGLAFVVEELLVPFLREVGKKGLSPTTRTSSS